MKVGTIRSAFLALCILALLCSAALADTVRISGRCNVRQGPGLDYGVIDVASKGSALPYLGESRTDGRGVRWYKVDLSGRTGWVSSKYAAVKGGTSGKAPAAKARELAGTYMSSIDYVAGDLSLTHHYVDSSDGFTQYSNDSLTIGGYGSVECYDLYGAGYTIYGVGIGTKRADAERLLRSTGLVYDEDSDASALWYQHPASLKSPRNIDGFDGIICLSLRGGKVTEINWTSFSD